MLSLTLERHLTSIPTCRSYALYISSPFELSFLHTLHFYTNKAVAEIDLAYLHQRNGIWIQSPLRDYELQGLHRRIMNIIMSILHIYCDSASVCSWSYFSQLPLAQCESKYFFRKCKWEITLFSKKSHKTVGTNHKQPHFSCFWDKVIRNTCLYWWQTTNCACSPVKWAVTLLTF